MATQTAPVVQGNILTAALQIRAYNTKLRTESVLPDVFETLSSEIKYSENGTKMPDAILMKLEKSAAPGAHTQVVPLLMRLQGAPTYGQTTLVGTEETLRVRHMICYYNLIRKAVAMEGYGVNANDMAAYNLYGQVQPMLSEWFKELRGKRLREASLLRYASELVEANIGSTTALKHHFNSNIFVCNRALGGMPVYDVDEETEAVHTYPANGAIGDSGYEYVDKICEVLSAATNAFANPERAVLSLEALLALDYHCTVNLKLEPIDMGGKPTLIFVVPSAGLIKLLNPANSTGVGAIWKDVMALTKFESAVPGAQFRVRNLLIVEDMRHATVTVNAGGSTPNYTLTPGFYQPGNLSGRNDSPWNNTTNRVFDVGCVYGKGALTEWKVQALKFATESYDYELVQGKGAYECSGIQLTQFNVDTETEASNFNRGSCIVLLPKGGLVTVT